MAIDINVPSQVKSYANLAAFPVTGSLKTIFIAEDTNKTYRWTGSVYVEISATAASTWGAITGTLSNQTDLQNALNAKQDTLVSATNIKTINGTTLLGSGDLVVGGGVTIGTTAITSGTVGRVLFEGTGNVVQESANLFWDNTNGRLGIGGTPSTYNLDVVGIGRFRTSSGSYIAPLTVENTGSASDAFKNVALFIGARGNASSIDDNTNIGIWQKSAISNNYATVNFFNSGGNLASFFGGQFVNHGGANNGNLIFGTALSGSATVKMTLASSGNLLINTTTDAGYKLDVNGTARVKTTDTSTPLNVLHSGAVGISIEANSNGYRLRLASSGTVASINTPDSYLSINNAGQLVVIGSTSTYNSAQLAVDSTTKGFLPPRMTTTQKNAIASPATGLMVYDTTLNLMALYNGTVWTTL